MGSGDERDVEDGGGDVLDLLQGLSDKLGAVEDQVHSSGTKSSSRRPRRRPNDEAPATDEASKAAAGRPAAVRRLRSGRARGLGWKILTVVLMVAAFIWYYDTFARGVVHGHDNETTTVERILGSGHALVTYLLDMRSKYHSQIEHILEEKVKRDESAEQDAGSLTQTKQKDANRLSQLHKEESIAQGLEEAEKAV
eukprot:jgi/Chlat1/7429/Chrsp6S07449